MIAGLLTLDAQLLRRDPSGPPDEYGNPGWVAVGEPVKCELQLTTSFEDHDAAVQTSTYRAILEPAAAATEVRGWDALEQDGITYELDGDAWRARNPRTGVFSHVEAVVRRVE